MAQQFEVLSAPQTLPIDTFPIAPPPPEQELRQAAIAPSEMSRRSFVKMAGGVATGFLGGPVAGFGALGVDQQVSRILQSEDIETAFVERSAARRFPETALIVLPGFNVYGGAHIARAIVPSVSAFAQIASVHYGNRAFDPGAIKQNARKFLEENRLARVYLYGHSLGGMLGIEMASYLHKEGVEVLGVFNDCSPTDRQDVKQVDDMGFDFVNMANYISLYGGIGTRYAIEVGVNLKNQQAFDDATHNAKRVLAADVCSTTLGAQQVSYLYYYNLASQLEDLPRNIPIAYLGPQDTNRDQVVNNDTSCNRLMRERVSERYTKRFRMPNTSHASVNADAETYNRCIRMVHAQHMSPY